MRPSSCQRNKFTPEIARAANRALHVGDTQALGALFQRLPQLHAVAIAVLDPGEATVALVLALRIDPDSGRRQRFQQSVEVVHALVDHYRLLPLAEVARVHREGVPRRHACHSRRTACLRVASTSATLRVAIVHHWASLKPPTRAVWRAGHAR